MRAKKIRLRTFLSVVAASAVLQGCGAFSDDSKVLDRAEAAIDRGDYKEAMILLHGALEKAPEDARGQLLTARAATMLGDYAGAERALSKADQHGAQGSARVRAELFVRSGQGEKALAWLDAEPQRQQPWTPPLRLRALSFLNRCEEALTLARQLATQDAYKGGAALASAECHIRAGSLARAMKELTAASVSSPESAEVWVALGQLARLTGDLPKAEAAWNEAAKRAGGQLSAPQKLLLYAGLGDLQSERGDVDGLRDTYKKLAKLAAESSIVDMLAARIAFVDGKTAEAVNTLRGIVSKEDNLPPAHTLLLAAYLEQGNFEQARRELAWLQQHLPASDKRESIADLVDSVEKAGAGTVERARQLAQAQARLGLFDIARNSLTRAHGAYPADEATSLMLARLDLRMARVADAQAVIQPLLATRSDDPIVLRTQVDIFVAAGKFSEADAVLAKMLAKNPDPVTVMAQHRVRSLGKLANPEAPLLQWLEKHPNEGAVRALYADWLRASGKNAQAIVEYESLIAQGPENPVLLNNLAWIYILEGDRRAVTTAQRALKLAPQSVSIADTYGWALVRSGAKDEGLTVLRDADQRSKGAVPELRYHLATALAESGDAAGARRVLEALLSDADEFTDRGAASELLVRLRETKANVTQ